MDLPLLFLVGLLTIFPLRLALHIVMRRLEFPHFEPQIVVLSLEFVYLNAVFG